MPRVPNIDDFDYSQQKSLNRAFSIDGQISAEKIAEYQSMPLKDQLAWLEENFGGDESPEYNRGLVAGYIKAFELSQIMPRSNWTLWVQAIIIHLTKRCHS